MTTDLLWKLRQCVTSPALLAKFFPDYFNEVGVRALHMMEHRSTREGGTGGLRYSGVPLQLRPRPMFRAFVGWPLGTDGLSASGALPLAVLRQVLEICTADRAKYRDTSARSDWGREHDGLRRPLTRDEVTRRRYMPQSNLDEVWGPRFAPGIGLYVQLLKPQASAAVSRWVDILGHFVRGVEYHSSVIDILKVVDGWAKVQGDSLVYWKELVGLSSLGAYVEAPPLDFFVEDVKTWVSGPVPPIGEALPGWFDCFRQAARLFVSECEPRFAPCSLEEFAVSGVWIRPGATDQGDFPVMTLAGHEVGYRRNKDMMYLGTDPAALIAMARAPAAPARAIVKREVAKARAVIVTDTPTYLRMSWLSEALERSLRRARGASLFFTGKRLAQMWYELASQGGDTQYWKFPIDQSKFDHMVTRDMLLVVLDECERLLLGEDQKAVLRQVRNDLCIADSYVAVGNERVPVTKGVLSGWRWTALFDTWINFAEVVGSLMYLQKSGVIVDYSLENVYFQGDDVRFLCRNPAVGVALCEIMRAAGFLINPQKTWSSVLRDEFLRMVGEEGAVAGYLARSIPSIMWRNPIKQASDDVVEVVRAAVSRWEAAVGRGADPVRVRRHALADLKGICRGRLSQGVLRQWLRSPAWAGGLEAAWLLGSSVIDPCRSAAARDNVACCVRAVVPSPRLRGGLFPGVARLIDEFSGLGLKSLGACVEEYAVGVVRPYLGLPEYRDPPSYEVEYVTGVAQHPPLGRCPPDAPPIKAKWAGRYDYSPWFKNVLLQSALRDKRLDIIDTLLDEPSRMWSRSIASNHPRSVWVSWVQGSLGLTTRRWLGWNTGFVGAMSRARAVTVVRSCLASSRRWSLPLRRGVERWYYLTQRDPASVYPLRVGT